MRFSSCLESVGCHSSFRYDRIFTNLNRKGNVLMTTTMGRTDELTSAQYEVINVLSCLHRKDDVVAQQTKALE